MATRQAHGDFTGALAAADALALEAGPAVVAAELARVYLHAAAGDTTAALAALTSLETLAPGSVEVALARSYVGDAVPAAGRGARAASPVSASVEARGEAEPAEAVSLAVWPNPASSGAVVTLTLAEPSDVTVTVYDVLGRAVATPLVGALAPGSHRAAVDAGSLAPGVYVVRAAAIVGGGVNSGGGSVVQTVRLTITR